MMKISLVYNQILIKCSIVPNKVKAIVMEMVSQIHSVDETIMIHHLANLMDITMEVTTLSHLKVTNL